MLIGHVCWHAVLQQPDSICNASLLRKSIYGLHRKLNAAAVYGPTPTQRRTLAEKCGCDFRLTKFLPKIEKCVIERRNILRIMCERDFLTALRARRYGVGLKLRAFINLIASRRIVAEFEKRRVMSGSAS